MNLRVPGPRESRALAISAQGLSGCTILETEVELECSIGGKSCGAHMD